MTFAQPELVGLPAPTLATAGRCQIPVVYGGARRPCVSQAIGTVPHWLAPLDPTQGTPGCASCAFLYRLELDRWLF